MDNLFKLFHLYVIGNYVMHLYKKQFVIAYDTVWEFVLHSRWQECVAVFFL